jgi:hypothetical protein
MLEMLKIKQAETDIEDNRTKIIKILSNSSATLKSPQLTAISTTDIALLFRLYDEVFLQNWFREHFKGKMKFSLSGKMTKSAGKTMCPKNIGRIRQEDLVLEIRLGVDFFLDYGQHSQSNTVCGIKTESALEALLLFFEHELCHVLEFLLFNKSSCKGKRFKAMANNVFGHTDSYHKLPTNRQIAAREFGFKLGDTVAFDFKERRLTGFLHNINKRATVLVPDRKGPLVDRRGTRYSKYYVPLTKLQAGSGR